MVFEALTFWLRYSKISTDFLHCPFNVSNAAAEVSTLTISALSEFFLIVSNLAIRFVVVFKLSFNDFSSSSLEHGMLMLAILPSHFLRRPVTVFWMSLMSFSWASNFSCTAFTQEQAEWVAGVGVRVKGGPFHHCLFFYSSHVVFTMPMHQN